MTVCSGLFAVLALARGHVKQTTKPMWIDGAYSSMLCTPFFACVRGRTCSNKSNMSVNEENGEEDQRILMSVADLKPIQFYCTGSVICK